MPPQQELAHRDALAPALASLARKARAWRGTGAELIAKLRPYTPDGATDGAAWPAAPGDVADWLGRNGPRIADDVVAWRGRDGKFRVVAHGLAVTEFTPESVIDGETREEWRARLADATTLWRAHAASALALGHVNQLVRGMVPSTPARVCIACRMHESARGGELIDYCAAPAMPIVWPVVWLHQMCRDAWMRWLDAERAAFQAWIGGSSGSAEK